VINISKISKILMKITLKREQMTLDKPRRRKKEREERTKKRKRRRLEKKQTEELNQKLNKSIVNQVVMQMEIILHVKIQPLLAAQHRIIQIFRATKMKMI
jgi:hypothetical protein